MHPWTVLSGMESLEVLNLYRTRVTNSGLATLQSLKKLTDVDVRYSRVTPNGVDALHAALPRREDPVRWCCPPQTQVAAAGRPADSTEQAIAAWVKAHGWNARSSPEAI